MTTLRKDYVTVFVEGSAAIKGTPAVAATPGYYTTVNVISYGEVTNTSQLATAAEELTTPVTTTSSSSSATEIISTNSNTDPVYRMATREEITVMLIGTTYENQKQVYNFVTKSYEPKYSRCDITLMEMTLATTLPYMHVKVPYQKHPSGSNLPTTSEIALAWYTSDGIMAPAFCIGSFPSSEANPLYNSEGWDASDVYTCTETDSGIVSLTYGTSIPAPRGR